MNLVLLTRPVTFLCMPIILHPLHWRGEAGGLSGVRDHVLKGVKKKKSKRNRKRKKKKEKIEAASAEDSTRSKK